jgi:hypothetical protein
MVASVTKKRHERKDRYEAVSIEIGTLAPLPDYALILKHFLYNNYRKSG